MEGNKVDWRRTEVGRSAGLLRAFNAIVHLPRPRSGTACASAGIVEPAEAIGDSDVVLQGDL